jgi:hypothetical protein
VGSPLSGFKKLTILHDGMKTFVDLFKFSSSEVEERIIPRHMVSNFTRVAVSFPTNLDYITGFELSNFLPTSSSWSDESAFKSKFA